MIRKIKLDNIKPSVDIFFIIGLSATGKTTISKKISKKLKYKLISVDEIIREIAKTHPDFPNSKKGYPKDLQLEDLIKIAKEINGNIIIKAGKNAKWYIKNCNIENINDEIKKQKWRDTSRCTMYIFK